jgi:hypothetical protein
MNSRDAEMCDRLRTRFDGRQAIYVEMGVLRVRVVKIRPRVDRRIVSAEVEEIPTAGLGVGVFPAWREGRNPLRWKIDAGYLTTFSDDCWSMGYGGWSLFFETALIQDVVDLAARFSDGLCPGKEYEETLRHLYTQRRTPAERVFADITPSDGGEYQKPEKLSDASLKSQPEPTTG